MKNAVVLWTGGKDSYLAYCMAKDLFSIQKLVLFAPMEGDFHAHPIDIQKIQAKLLNLPLEIKRIGKPYKESYIAAIKDLKTEDNISTLITGDIDYIAESPNWIKECAESAEVHTFIPLWKMKRKQVIQNLQKRNAKVIISCVDKKQLESHFLGREINDSLLKEFSGIDLCGENGEYHTIVLNGEGFDQELIFETSVMNEDDNYAWLEFEMKAGSLR